MGPDPFPFRSDSPGRSRRGSPPPRSGRHTPDRRSPASPADGEGGPAVLERVLRTRLRACRALGVRVPVELSSGPAGTLLLRVAALDRRLTRALDLRGGARLPPWPGEPPEEPREDEEDPGGEDAPCPA